MRSKRIAMAAAALGATAAGAAWFGAARWRRQVRALRAALDAVDRPDRRATHDRRELEGLPAPVARYFAAAMREGQPIVRRAAISWRGEFNLGRPGNDRWRRFTAQQWFSPASPGFVWNARMSIAPGVGVYVRDALVDGVGSTHAAVLGLVPVADSEGKSALAVAALQRYLGEAAWLPTALLPSQGVAWTAIAGDRALATLSAGDVTASAEFRFGADGLIESVFVPNRLFDDGKHPPAPRPWQGRHGRYRECEGLLVPSASEVEWLLPAGPFPYWRGRPLTIEYEFGALET
jgi:hypothetical protein